MRFSKRGLTATAFLIAYLAVSARGATNYVWAGGSHTPPYSTWGTAATSMRQ
jgi:hypothetical protein